MHLLEKYALSTGSKIGKPFILKKYFPVDAEKYITIQNSSGMPGKCYDFFEDVINFLLPLLNKNNYKIVQLGGNDDRKISGAIDLTGKTNINQTAYIISNSLLHLGNDSFAVHMASAFNVPTVALYSITTPELAGPYWDNKKINLYPHTNSKPSFNPNESPKTVNNITIEEVVNACEKLLFNEQTVNVSSIYLGDRYKDNLIESIPNQGISPDFFKGSVLNLRFDYLEDTTDLSATIFNLSNRKCAIVTDKTINIEALAHVKQNIEIIIYNVTKNINIEFVKKLNLFGVNYVCTFDQSNTDESLLEQRKFELMDYCEVHLFSSIPSNIPEKIQDNVIYKSNRILLSNGKIYNSRSAQLNNLPSIDKNSTIKYSDIKIDKQEFLKDLEYCYLYTEN